MGDYTGLHIEGNFSEWTDKDWKKLLTILDREVDVRATADDRTSGSIEAYDVRVGTAHDLFASLTASKRIAAHDFTVWEEPKYEWLGTLLRHTPGGEPFEGECDSNGSILLTDSTVAGLLSTHRADPAAFMVAVAALVGVDLPPALTDTKEA